MKTYRIEHTRPGADDPCDEWIPAEVAQRLYDQLEKAIDIMDNVLVSEGHYLDGDDLDDALEALAAADGEEV